MNKIQKYLSTKVAEKIRREIREAHGNEVFFVGYTEEDLVVHEIDVAARGDKSAVPAVIKKAEEADVVIHNHPTGHLTPSEADLNIAAHLDSFSVAFYITDNAVEDIYVAVEPFEKKEVHPIKTEEMEYFLKPGGPVSKALPGYEYRPQQIEMIDMASQAFNQSKVCTIEAGTGTGKTMAYLLPAIFWATANKERVVISTNTINLQEQLIKKDIPFLQKNLNVDFTAVLVKGRGNYVCLRKVDEIEQDFAALSDEDEMEELKHLIAWARDSRDGSKSDLSFIPSQNVWEKIASESDTCIRSKCRHFRTCFVNKARRNASRAHILVVNHHLLFADLAIRHHIGSMNAAAVLPPYQRIIFDEAHHLEDVATNYFGIRITRWGIIRMLNRLHRIQKSLPKGQLHNLHHQLLRKKRYIPGNLFEKLTAKLDSDLADFVNVLVGETHDIMDLLFQAVTERSRESENREIKLRMLPHVVEQIFRDTELGNFFKDYIRNLKSFCQSLYDLLDLVGLAEKYVDEGFESQTIEIQAQADRLVAVAEGLNQVIFSDDEDHIRWIEVKSGYRGRSVVRFQSSPLDITDMMKSAVYDMFSTVIMTSATLAVDQKFDYLANRIGLAKLPNDRRTEIILHSPFHFDQQVLLAVPLDVPAPNHPSFAAELTKMIFKAITISDGRAFVLFTSYGLLQIVHNQLKESLEMVGIRVLKQGTENRHELLKRFRKDKTSVLFGTDSFWEGVDVVGDALQSVIITKLPFRVPNEPIIEARYEAIEKNGGNAFMEYAVPLAVLKFKQGFGRLIRSKSDRGSVIIFDNRIVNKSYGKKFLRSLPDCHEVIGNREKVFSELKKFY
ncbi:MAG: DEAD/DEAH box helicase [Actinobacteria bacterium]|nr:DEAD/DEAH box helicase [Actinomycetota bacterium]